MTFKYCAPAIAVVLTLSACGDDPDPTILHILVSTTTGAQSTDADIELCLTRGDTNEELCDLLDDPLHNDFESNQEDTFSAFNGIDLNIARAGGFPAVKNVYFKNTSVTNESWNMTAFALDAFVVDTATESHNATWRVCAEHDISAMLYPGDRYSPESCP
ncbi:hypothetical protein BE11_19670 [Sorangium cellulosum]|nr:hypothetical protein BE11_19670 [Sorangium cellulosum]